LISKTVDRPEGVTSLINKVVQQKGKRKQPTTASFDDFVFNSISSLFYYFYLSFYLKET